MLRHEQQSIRMALATVMHHSYKVHTEYGAPRGQNDSHQGQGRVGGTEFYAMSEGSDVVGGSRPPSLMDVWRQERVQQRTVKQIVDPVPSVPVASRRCGRRWWTSWWTFSHLSISVLPSRLSRCPRSWCPPRAARTVLGAPQTAEQLVEVPTEPAYALAVVAVQAIGLSAAMALAEQIVDKPVPQVRAVGWRRSSRFSSRTGYSSSGHGADR